MAARGDSQSSLPSPPECQAVLRRLVSTDGRSQEGFDRLARLAGRVLHAPMALVGLVAGGHAVLKSGIGLPARWRSQHGGSLTRSLCEHLRAAGGPLVMEDARGLLPPGGLPALGELGVVALVACPLSCLGESLGTLCVLDTRERRWTEDDVQALRELAAFAMVELELLAVRELELATRARQAEREAATARTRMALLVDAGALLAHVTQCEAALQRLVERLVPVLGDLCVLDLLREEPFTPGARVAHVEPGGADRLHEMLASGPRREEWLASAEPRPLRLSLGGASPSRAGALEALMPRLGVHSLLRVPVLTSEGLEGLLTLGRGRREARPYQDAELEMARTLAERIAAALENARLLQKVSEGIRQRDEFLSIAAHELRTPLTPLKLQLDTLRRSVAAAGIQEPRLIRHLERSTAQVQSLAHLVERLLDLSRVSTGRLGLLLEDLELSSLASMVTDRFREEAEAAGCQLEVHTPGPVHGMWDQLRLEQVLSSLLSNAIKYGAGQPIDVLVEGSEGLARMSVRDRGIGIAREDASRIFERFERAVAPGDFKGLGLGLYVAKQIIEAHGGTILVQSQPGEGSTFTVILPTRSPPRHAAPEEDAPAAPSRT